MKNFADESQLKILADPAAVEAMIRSGDASKRIRGVILNDENNFSKFKPFEFCYLPYKESLDPGIFGDDSFHKATRSKLIYGILTAPKVQNGFEFAIEHFKYSGKLLSFFPTRDLVAAKQLLKYTWKLNIFPYHVPVEDIRRYFGEKIALFYVFLGHYSLWLFWPSGLGVIVQSILYYLGTFFHPWLLGYTIFMLIWSISMLEYWEREENRTMLRWGMTDFDRKEALRPQFVGDMVVSPINGRPIVYFPVTRSLFVKIVSYLIVFLFLLVVISVVIGIYMLRFILQSNESTAQYASMIASTMNSIQVSVFNSIYAWLAVKLTDFENHATNSHYNNSLMVKLFGLQFINSFASFFFLAFIAGNLDRPTGVPDNFVGQCGAENCLQPLTMNLAMIFGTRLISSVFSIVSSYFSYHQTIKKAIKAGGGKFLTPPEADFVRIPYDTDMELIKSYADIALEYAFTMLFVAALPAAPFLSLIASYVKMKLHIFQLVEVR